MSVVDSKHLERHGDQPHSSKNIEDALLSLYKHNNGNVHLEMFDPYPVEIVLGVYKKLQDNFRYSINKASKKMSDNPAEIKKILRLAFDLDFNEGNPHSKTFFYYLNQRVYLAFKQHGLFEKVAYESLYEDDYMAMFLLTGTEEDEFVMDEKYRTYASVVGFFETEIAEQKNGKVVHKTVAATIASQLVDITNMTAANMKARMQQVKFKERLNRLDDYDLKADLTAFLEAYHEAINQAA